MASRRVVKKKVTISANDNIIPDPDVALELGKSISITEAKEEEAARQVHATHARILTESVPKPAKKKTGSRSTISIVIQDTPSPPKSNPKTLDEAFSSALAAEARFTDLQLLEFLSSYPLTLGEAFFGARIIEAHFEDENNQAVDANVGNQEEPKVKDKQEVKKADDQEIENIQDEEGKNVEDQQVSEADDDTNIDDFGCLLPHHKGADLIVEEVVLENIKSDLKEDEDEQGKKRRIKELLHFLKLVLSLRAFVKRAFD
ncbi:hypothetical protein Tco_1501670 [Tanacetum coccineum]